MSIRVKTYKAAAGNINKPIEEFKLVAGDCLFVSANYSGYGSPYFTTIQAAITAATSGDLITVYPGDYPERLTAKNGVDLHLWQGVRLNPATGANEPVIDITDCSLSITGGAVIDYTPTALDVTPPIRISGASDVQIKMDSIKGFVPPVLAIGTNALQVKGTSTARIDIRLIESSIEFDGEATAFVYSDRIEQRIKMTALTSKATIYTDQWQFIETTDGYLKVFFSESIGNESKLYIMGGYTELVDGNIEVTLPNGSGSGGMINSHVTNVLGGILRLKHVRVAVNDALSQVPCALITNGVLISDDVTYKSDVAYSLDGTGIVKNYGSVANKTTNGVLVLVEPIIVDINVE
jgi:hypothetical protein